MTTPTPAPTCKTCGARLVEVVVAWTGYDKVTRRYERRGGKGRKLVIMPGSHPSPRYGFPGPPHPRFWASDLITVKARDLEKHIKPIVALECPDDTEEWHRAAEENRSLPYFRARKLGVLQEKS